MKKAHHILDLLEFPDDFDLDFDPKNKKLKNKLHDLAIYEGSSHKFNHHIISVYEYSIKKDQNYTSLDICIHSKKENQVLKKVLEEEDFSSTYFASLKDNLTIKTIPLEGDLLADFIKKNNTLIIQIFKYNR